MFVDYKVIPNFFQNPDFIRELALAQYYRDSSNEEGFVAHSKKFPGRRTDNLYTILDQETYSSIMREFYSRLLFGSIRKDINLNYNINGFPVFHSLFKNDDGLGYSGYHRDSTIYAAVVYLNNAPDDGEYGTTVYIPNASTGVEKPFTFPYQYNTCVMYRGEFLHGAENAFGNTIETSRLSMNFFISDLDFSIRSPTLA